MLGLVGCGGGDAGSADIKTKIEKIAVEKTQKYYSQMSGDASQITVKVEKCEVNGDKAECTVVCKNKEGETEGKIVRLTKMGDNWCVTGMRSAE